MTGEVKGNSKIKMTGLIVVSLRAKIKVFDIKVSVHTKILQELGTWAPDYIRYHSTVDT